MSKTCRSLSELTDRQRDKAAGRFAIPRPCARSQAKRAGPARSRSRKISRLLLFVVPNQANASLPVCVQTALAPRWRALHASVFQSQARTPALAGTPMPFQAASM